MDYLILVNKENPLTKEVNIDDLTLFSYSLYEKYREIYVSCEAAIYLRKMLEDVNEYCKKNGFNEVVLDEGFRTREYQLEIMNFYKEVEGDEKAKSRVAPADASEHRTGLGVDFSLVIEAPESFCEKTDNYLYHYLGNNKWYKVDPEEDDPEMKWLQDNSYKYGFILRYPKGKEEIFGYMMEPWHFRFVGSPEVAKEIYDNNLTLEEYITPKSKVKKL